MRRVASGEYDPSRERCVELKSNPASRIKAVRTQQLEALKKENEALIGEIEKGELSIPIESFQRLRQEKEDLEKAHAKRLLRLKEVSR